MDAREHLERISVAPKDYYTLGLGTSCWAVVNHRLRDEVVLLERPKEMQVQAAVDRDPYAGSTSRGHNRAVRFAKTYDRYLIPGLQREDGGKYQHASHLSSLSEEQFGTPKLLWLGKGAVFPAHSIRVVERVQGTPLSHLQFLQAKSPLREPERVDALAQDIAHWLFTVHHRISPKAIEGNNIAKQFADAGVAMTGRFERSDKYQLFVSQNTRELEILSRNMAEGTMNPEVKERMERNLRAAGVSMPLLLETAKTVGERLKPALARDRYGLIHSDLHPGNIIVDSTQTNVNGVCDWANGGVGPQSIDFAGLGIAKGLLPRVVTHYERLEQKHGVTGAPVDREAIFGMAAMRQLFMATKQLKYGDANPEAIASWQRVGECMAELRKMDPKTYRTVGRNVARSARNLGIRSKAPEVASHPTTILPGIRLSPS